MDFNDFLNEKNFQVVTSGHAIKYRLSYQYGKGGFVAMGGEERADDVPARLSKNEFVFTADAVRNAGEGDIDKGAEVMYNMMKNLESGGDVSEESQGLDGAREMFKTSQRLEEVL